MSSSNVLVNDKVRIKVKFIDIDSVTGNQVEVEPVPPVPVTVKDSDGNLVESGNATALTSSTYYYDYTPTQPGTYTVKFVGTIVNLNFATPTTTQIPVSQQLYVSTPTEEYKPTITLRADETIFFGADINPLYMDPEEIQRIFPDATALEIAELIHAYSHEVNALFGVNIDSELDPMTVIGNYGASPFSIAEYIRASVACELTRIYGFGGDDELSVELADLKIMNRNTPRNNISRANATTWCQIAAALRKEILTKRVNIRSVLPKGLPKKVVVPAGGSLDPQTGALIYVNDTNVYGPRDQFRPGVQAEQVQDDPMPDRGIKRYD